MLKDVILRLKTDADKLDSLSEIIETHESPPIEINLCLDHMVSLIWDIQTLIANKVHSNNSKRRKAA